MIPGPDLFPAGEQPFGIDLFADRRDAGRTLAWLAIAISLVVLIVIGALWWFDREGAPPTDRPMTHHALARLEQTEERP